MEEPKQQITEKLIDLDGLLKSKKPKLYAILPRFLVNYFKKILHQDDINNVLEKYKDVYGLDFVDVVLKHFGITVKINGAEKYSKDKKYIFAGNHPLGGLDGLALIHAVGKSFPNVKAIINQFLLYIQNLKPVFSGVSIYANTSKKQLSDLKELFDSENQVIVFPSGMVSRKIKGQITDLKWKKSFVNQSIQYKRDIVPVYIEGRNSNFFYNFAKLRKLSGIKLNIEMIFLPDEMFNYKSKEIIIHFGEPISYQTFDNSKNKDQWSEYIREKVYSIKQNNNLG